MTEDELVERLKASRKYGALAPDVLRWAAQDGLQHGRGARDAEKRAKRKLHQAFAAFLGSGARSRILRALHEAVGCDDQRREQLFSEVLVAHASTGERGDGSELWAAVREAAGPISSVLDLGCGVGPLTLEVSGLDGGVDYLGVDLDSELCAALQAALAPRWPSVRVHPGDARTGGPWPSVDVALLLKLLPTLERQQAGAAEAVLASVDARVVVATFPTRSLSGRERGMADHYAGLAARWLPGCSTSRIGDELVCIRVR